MTQMNEMLTPHFSLYELCRSETAARHGIDNIPPLVKRNALAMLSDKILEPVRAHFKQPFRPSSGYRGPELNKLIGGSKRSQHCDGEAVDFEVPGVDNFELATWISKELDFDQLILECYVPGVPTSGWVHCSYVIEATNRKDVLTYSDRRYSVGLVR